MRRSLFSFLWLALSPLGILPPAFNILQPVLVMSGQVAAATAVEYYAPTFGAGALPTGATGVISWLSIAVLLLLIAGVRLQSRSDERSSGAPRMQADGRVIPGRFSGNRHGWIVYVKFTNQPVHPVETATCGAVVPWVRYYRRSAAGEVGVALEKQSRRAFWYPVRDNFDVSSVSMVRVGRPDRFATVDFGLNGIPYQVELASRHDDTLADEVENPEQANGQPGGNFRLLLDDELIIEIELRGSSIRQSWWFGVRRRGADTDILNIRPLPGRPW